MSNKAFGGCYGPFNMFAIKDVMNALNTVSSFVYSLVKAMVMYSEGSLPKPKGLNLDKPLPKSLPTAIEIKRVIPSYCFEASTTRSLLYACKDVVQIMGAWALISYLLPLTGSFPVKIVLLAFYWAVQGTFFMALFVMGHDCGHNSFSKYVLLNDIVGTISHSFLLVPYYQWKLTHRTHHKFTGNMDKDEVFYPTRESQQKLDWKVLPGFGYGFGWYIYLAEGYFPRRVRHFNPFSKAFHGHFIGCISSLLCYAVFVYMWFLYYKKHGFLSLLIFYLIPLFIFGSYVVIITFLHHTEMNIPWYGDGISQKEESEEQPINSWDFVKGQLSTIDRDYGIVHHTIHCIGTHQMHHLFTRIPHYHLEEATQHFRKAFPELAKSCDEPILPSFVRMFKKYALQSTVPDDIQEMVYK